MCSTLSQKFSQSCIWNSSNVHLMMHSLVLSRKIVKHILFPHLSPPGDRWCDVLGFVVTGRVSNSPPTISISISRSHAILTSILLFHTVPTIHLTLTYNFCLIVLTYNSSFHLTLLHNLYVLVFIQFLLSYTIYISSFLHTIPASI